MTPRNATFSTVLVALTSYGLGEPQASEKAEGHLSHVCDFGRQSGRNQGWAGGGFRIGS